MNVNAYLYYLAEVRVRKSYGILLYLKGIREIVKPAVLERKGGKSNTFTVVSFKLNSFPDFFLLTRTTRNECKALLSKPPHLPPQCSVLKLH